MQRLQQHLQTTALAPSYRRSQVSGSSRKCLILRANLRGSPCSHDILQLLHQRHRCPAQAVDHQLQEQRLDLGRCGGVAPNAVRLGAAVL